MEVTNTPFPVHAVEFMSVEFFEHITELTGGFQTEIAYLKNEQVVAFIWDFGGDKLYFEVKNGIATLKNCIIFNANVAAVIRDYYPSYFELV